MITMRSFLGIEHSSNLKAVCISLLGKDVYDSVGQLCYSWEEVREVLHISVAVI